MEDRCRPKRTGQAAEGGDSESGGAAIGGEEESGWEGFNRKYGRGRYDEATGYYEYYEGVPKDLLREQGEPITWARILENWGFLEADFHSEYGVDVSSPKLRRRKTWRWFAVRVKGLLASPESRLGRVFQPDPEEPSTSTNNTQTDPEMETEFG